MSSNDHTPKDRKNVLSSKFSIEQLVADSSTKPIDLSAGIVDALQADKNFGVLGKKLALDAMLIEKLQRIELVKKSREKYLDLIADINIPSSIQLLAETYSHLAQEKSVAPHAKALMEQAGFTNAALAKAYSQQAQESSVASFAKALMEQAGFTNAALTKAYSKQAQESSVASFAKALMEQAGFTNAALTKAYSQQAQESSVASLAKALIEQEDFAKLSGLVEKAASFQNFPYNREDLIRDTHLTTVQDSSLSIEDVEIEITEQTKTSRDFLLLSPAARGFIIDFLLFFIAYQLAEASQAEIMKRFSRVEQKIEDVMAVHKADIADVRVELGELKQGQAEMQRGINKLLRYLPTPEKQSIRDHRIVIASFVHLRKGRGKKYQSIALIPQGTFVKVVNSDNRSWLKVEVSHENELLEGWIYRSYTTSPKLLPGQVIVDELF